MTDLCLGNNQLTGALPSIDTLTGLKILSLHHNSIRSLATSINNLSVLEKIDLSYNALNTTIDATRFGNLPALKHLWLDNNQITG